MERSIITVIFLSLLMISSAFGYASPSSFLHEHAPLSSSSYGSYGLGRSYGLYGNNAYGSGSPYGNMYGYGGNTYGNGYGSTYGSVYGNGYGNGYGSSGYGSMYQPYWARRK